MSLMSNVKLILIKLPVGSDAVKGGVIGAVPLGEIRYGSNYSTVPSGTISSNIVK